MKPCQTFCVKPWIHLLIHPDGSLSPCCTLYGGPSKGKILKKNGEIYNIQKDNINQYYNSPLLMEIRAFLLAGKKHQECTVCWNTEDSGTESNRISANNLWKKDFTYNQAKEITDFKTGGVKTLRPFDFDLRLSNLCNLKCRPCDPTKSGALILEWEKLEKTSCCFSRYFQNSNIIKFEKGKKHFIWHEKNEMRNEIYKITKHAKKISFSGGEPFIIKSYNVLLKGLINQNVSNEISLRYETNLTFINRELVELWPIFKRIELAISLDGVFKVNDYIRYPSKFENIDINIRELINFKKANMKMWIEVTVSIFNIYYLPELISYYNDNWSNNLKIKFHFLFSPTPYSITILPVSIKNAVKEKIDNFIDRTDLSNEIISYLNGINKFMFSSTHPSDLFDDFLEITSILDQERDQNIFDYLPEFSRLIEEYLF